MFDDLDDHVIVVGFGRVGQAGADVAESPYETYGSRLADAALIDGTSTSLEA